MKKLHELNDPESCWSKAEDDEILFILLERDDATPRTIRFWITERIRLGLNRPGDIKLVNAERCAQAIETGRGFRLLTELLDREPRS